MRISDWIEANRAQLEAAGWSDGKTFQNFWRCAHHTRAMENFFEGRRTCEWACHCQPLRWYHNGEYPMPKSWGSELKRYETISK